MSISPSDKSANLSRTNSLPPPKTSPRVNQKTSVAQLKDFFEGFMSANAKENHQPRKINRSVSDTQTLVANRKKNLLTGSSPLSMQAASNKTSSAAVVVAPKKPPIPFKPKFQLNLTNAYYEAQKINEEDSKTPSSESPFNLSDPSDSPEGQNSPIIMHRSYSSDGSPSPGPEQTPPTPEGVDFVSNSTSSSMNSSLEVLDSPRTVTSPRYRPPSPSRAKMQTLPIYRRFNISPQRQRINHAASSDHLKISEVKYSSVLSPADLLSSGTPRNQPSPRLDISGFPYIRAPLNKKAKKNSKLIKKEEKFNESLGNHLFQQLKSNKFICLRDPSAGAIENDAYNYFKRQVILQTQAYESPSNQPFSEVIESRTPRALKALKPLWENGVLLDSLCPRLKFLRNEIYSYLSGQRGKVIGKKQKKTLWSEELFNLVNSLINLRKAKKLTLTKEFIKICEKELIDQNIKDLIIHTLGGESNFQNILATLRKWSNESEILDILKLKVLEIDSKTAVEEIDLNIKRISLLKHTWVEMPNSSHLIANHSVEDVIRCFIPDNDLLINKITLNREELKFGELGTVESERQLNFYIQFFTHIYRFFDPKTDSLSIRRQAEFMVDILSAMGKKKKHSPSSKVKIELSEKKINWANIKALLPFGAIPWDRVIEKYDPKLHKEKFIDFLANLSIPCLPLLKLCTNNCWGRADTCIRKLFPNLFHLYGAENDQNPIDTMVERKGARLVCHISITSSEEYSVTQLKKYSVHQRKNPKDRLSVQVYEEKLATINFKWTVSPYAEDFQKTWLGVLEIPSIEINLEASSPKGDEEEKKAQRQIGKLKKQIVKTLNNPKIVDALDLDMDSPRIESKFRENPATEFD